MSCCKIGYEMGSKVLLPVLTRKDFLEWRGLAVHKDNVEQVRTLCEMGASDEEIAAVKQKLLQFNFSLSTEKSNVLKGNKTPSTTFAMDIDHIPAEEMADVAKRIIEKKDEVGLLFLERSVRCEGYHLVMRRDCTKSQVDNLKQAAEILGVEPDWGAKDVTRVYFSTTNSPEDLLYLDDELFRMESAPIVEEKNVQGFSHTIHTGKGVEVIGSEVTLSKLAEKEGQDVATESTTFGLKVFDLCLEESGLSQSEIDIPGERNWHNTLKAILSVGLCQFIEKEQLLAVLKKRMPNYYETEDCRRLVSDFYKNYSDPNGRMTLTQRTIYARAIKESQKEEASLSESQFPLTENTIALPRLPRLLQILVRAYPAEFRPAVIVSSLVFIGTLLSRLRAYYLDGSVHSPSFFACVVAPQASGKSFSRRLYEILTAPIKAQDKIYRKMEQDYKKAKDSSKNAKQQPVEPETHIRLLPATTSNAIILKRADMSGGLHLCTYAEEIDTLTKGQKAGAWSQKSDIYRMAFDNAEWGQDYMSDNSYSACVQLYYNLLVCGTPNAMNRYFSDVEDGLVSRVTFVELPDMMGARMPKFAHFNRKDAQEIRDTVQELYEMGTTPSNLPQGEESDGLLWVNCPKLTQAIDGWLEDRRQEYLQNQDNPALEIFRRRSAVIGFRAGLVAYALSGMHYSTMVSEFALWVANFTLQNQLSLFGERMNQVMQKVDDKNSEKTNHQGRNYKLLEELPETFSSSDVVNLRLSYGLTGEIYYIISRWLKNGLIAKVDSTHWEKI